MPVAIVGDTDSNQLIIGEEFARETHGVVVFNGVGSRIAIQSSRPQRHLRVDVDSNCSFEMGTGSFVNDLHVHLRHGSKARMGKDIFAIGTLRLFCHEKSELTLGNGCLIGDGVLCMTSDAHSVIDTKTRKRINPAADISVGNQVWIGAESVLLKGTRVGDGAIIAMRSVLMGEFPETCLIIGYPARVVKADVTWSPECLPVD